MKRLGYLMPLLFLLVSLIRAVPIHIFHVCSDTKYTANSTYRSSLGSLLSSLSSNSTRHRFYNSSSEDPAGQLIQGLYQCRGDLSLDTCRDSVTYATMDVLRRCPSNTSALVQYEECLLRFSDGSIVSVLSMEAQLEMANVRNVTEPERAKLNSLVRATLSESAIQASKKPSKFVAKETSTNGNLSDFDQIYSLVQCTEDLSASDCLACLQSAISRLPNCCSGKVGGRVFLPSCYFRYETYSFYNTSGVPVSAPSPSLAVVPSPPTPSPSGKSGISTVVVVAIVALVGASILLFCIGFSIGFYLVGGRPRRQEDPVYEATASSEITNAVPIQFDFGTIQAATNNFFDENKLGEGGFGQVFKGTLANGQEIAVKRLSRQSTQGMEEFKNEVLLVAKLQHRNLVRLQGFCVQDEENILVYEFVPNKSLDHFLFDPGKQWLLDWSLRYKIIGGIARGILYLHEDSRLRIIHRDLKASNILLDGDMNPKISDFGMARIFGVDQSRADTNRIAGTYGYMAPEYAMQGQFSIKSDVYSFGILVLEIVTGKKNNSFHTTDDCDALVSYVWKHWRDGTTLEVMDPTLEGTYSRREVIRCIHIALLCVQEDPIDRPTMTSVNVMLNSYSVTLALPQQPAFFHSRKYHSLNCSNDDKPISDVYPR